MYILGFNNEPGSTLVVRCDNSCFQRKIYFVNYLAALFLEVAASVVIWRVVEHQLQVGAGGREGDLRVALAAAALEAHLALLRRPVAVPRVPHLAPTIYQLATRSGKSFFL